MTNMGLLSMDQINQMDYEDFTKTFGNVVEHCSMFAASIWALRPFSNLKAIHSTFCDFIDSLPDIAQQGILRSHPDLAGRIADLGLLTSQSSKEQLAAELNTLSVEEKANLTELNGRYKQKFGFPFVICARENKKAAIINGIATRANNSPEVELRTGVNEVKKIAFYRLLDIVQHTKAEEQPS